MSLRLLLATLAVSLGFLVTPAHAKKGGIINTGDEMFEVADLPAALAPPGLSSPIKIGYLCNRFGIFWADVWTWDCKLVAIEGEQSYSDLPASVSTALAADPAFAKSKAKRGFWNHYGFWTVLGLLGAFILFGALTKSKETDSSPETQPA
ncbi:MAG: hypothetical protein RLZZ618_1173 [Pseudomonadota bacterium]|jgi:hypothetical protein